MIRGIDVILHQKVKTQQKDDFNKPIYEEVVVTVSNVLVRPVQSTDLVDTTDLNGRKEVYNLSIPKCDNHVWEDAIVEFFGKKFHVFTPVTQTIEALTPLSWNKKVQVERYE